MAKKVYIGVADKARKVKKIYIGVGNVARKVKKAYIGVGGVARPFWNGGEVAYYGTATPLAQARYDAMGTSVGNYALVGGGRTSSSYSTYVDTYNKSLIHSTATALSKGRTEHAAASNSAYAMFAGGYNGSRSAAVDAYNASLTHSTPADLIYSARHPSGANTGNYILIAGGYQTKQDSPLDDVNAYDLTLTRTAAPAMDKGYWGLLGGSINNYAVFGFGSRANPSTYIMAYNSSLTKVSMTSPSSSHHNGGCARTSKYLVFTGGNYYVAGTTYYTSFSTAYDGSLTMINAGSLPFEKFWDGAGASAGGSAVFTNGRDDGTSAGISDRVYMYDDSLTYRELHPLSQKRYNSAGASIGNYALFCGGGYNNSYDYTDVVDVYTA